MISIFIYITTCIISLNICFIMYSMIHHYWNFTKFIVDRSGNVVARFEPTEKMEKVDKFVEELI